MVFEILQFGFMQRALISGIAVAVSCSVIGLFLVLKKQSLYGDALSHVAFGGIAVGLFTNVYPIWTAFAVSILASLGITKLKESTKIPGDSAVAVLLSAGLAVGVVLIGLSGGFSLDLYSFLFGSILLINYNDQLVIVILTFIILAIMYKMSRKFIYIAFDEEQASQRNRCYKAQLSFHCTCKCYRDHFSKVSRSIAYLFINSYSKYYCNDVWKGI
jgi:zinc transport system permease protein